MNVCKYCKGTGKYKLKSGKQIVPCVPCVGNGVRDDLRSFVIEYSQSITVREVGHNTILSEESDIQGIPAIV